MQKGAKGEKVQKVQKVQKGAKGAFLHLKVQLVRLGPSFKLALRVITWAIATGKNDRINFSQDSKFHNRSHDYVKYVENLININTNHGKITRHRKITFCRDSTKLHIFPLFFQLLCQPTERPESDSSNMLRSMCFLQISV